MSEAAFRVLVAPDSFKGSLGASAVAERIRAGILRAVPEATSCWRLLPTAAREQQRFSLQPCQASGTKYVLPTPTA